MNVTIIHQYFKTPEEGGALRSYYIARYLNTHGHTVRVITAYNGRGYTVKHVEGVQIHYLPVYYTNHLTFYSRVKAFLRFVMQSVKLINRLNNRGKPGFYYVITTPLSTALIALYGKWFLKTPYVFEVGDLWPEAPIQLGILSNPFLKYGAKILEKTAYKNADMVIALSPAIAGHIKRISGRVAGVVTNFSDIGYFDQPYDKRQLKSKYGVDNKFVVSYIGTVGQANHLEYLLEIAKACKPYNEFHFIIMGEGARWDAIKHKANDDGLNNITFISGGSKQEAREVLWLCDVTYISFKNVPVLATGSPNKFFDGIAAKKPVIINFKGWIAGLINKNNCGFYADPLHPKDFVLKAKAYLHDITTLLSAGENAGKLARGSFALDKQLPKLRAILEDQFNKV